MATAGFAIDAFSARLGRVLALRFQAGRDGALYPLAGRRRAPRWILAARCAAGFFFLLNAPAPGTGSQWIPPRLQQGRSKLNGASYAREAAPAAVDFFFSFWFGRGGRRRRVSNGVTVDHTPIAPAMSWAIGRVLALDSGLARW